MKTVKMLILLVAVAVLALPLHAKYTEKLLVQVYDQEYRQVMGAQVYADHQLNAIAGRVKSKPVITNITGYANVVFTDYEEINASTDYSYILYVKYGDQLISKSMVANDETIYKPRFVQVQVQSHYAFVNVHDQANRPINASVTVGNYMDYPDAAGNVMFQLPPGEYTAKAEYNGVVRNRDFSLANDQAIDITIGIYHLEARVMDDNKRPIAAVVEVDGATNNTDETGIAAFAKVMNRNPLVVVRYGDAYKRLTADLELQPKIEVTFDIAKPVIKELYGTVSKNGVGTVSLFAEDPGTLPSGIDTVAITYEVSGVERPLPAYTVGYHTYEAKIPAQPPKTVVKYMAKVTDKEGNIATQSGSYLVPSNEEPRKNTTPSDPGTGGGTGIGAQPLELNTTTIAIGVVVFLVIAYGAYYYIVKKKQALDGTGGQPGAPPVQPPQQAPPFPKP